jgi:hypothetical protein
MLAIWKFSCNSFFKVSFNTIGAYIHACSTTTNTQIEKFNKFIGYLDELETKQKFKSVSYPADFLRKYLDSCTTHLNIISSVNIKQIFINNTKNGIQCFGKKTLTRAIFTCQYS